MDIKKLKRLQAISSRTSWAKSEMANNLITNLKAKLAERNYRADLKLVTASKNTTGTFKAETKYNPELGHPEDSDLIALVAQSYPDHQIDWDLVQVDNDNGVISLILEPAVEMIPVANINEIPPEFVAMGTAMYKKAADATGNINEIWSLKKTPEGLALFRNNNDMEIKAEDDQLKTGDVVDTPYGPGRIQRFDDLGNAFVQVGSDTKLVAAMDMKPYDIKKEKKKLTDYFSMAYGDPSYADALTKEYGDKK